MSETCGMRGSVVSETCGMCGLPVRFACAMLNMARSECQSVADTSLKLEAVLVVSETCVAGLWL